MWDFISSIFTDGMDAVFGEGWQESLGEAFGVTDMPMPEMASAEVPAMDASPPLETGVASMDVEAPDMPMPEMQGIVQPAMDAAPDILSTVKQQMNTGGKDGLLAWFSALGDKEKVEVTRSLMSAAGTGAAGVMQGLAQRNNQEFASEQSNKAREDRRGEEDRARAERESLRQVQRRNVSVTPRGIVASRWGG